RARPDKKGAAGGGGDAARFVARRLVIDESRPIDREAAARAQRPRAIAPKTRLDAAGAAAVIEIDEHDVVGSDAIGHYLLRVTAMDRACHVKEASRQIDDGAVALHDDRAALGKVCREMPAHGA